MIFLNDNVPFGARGMERYFRHIVRGLVDRFRAQVALFTERTVDYPPAHHVRALRFKGSEQIRLHDFLAAQAIRKLRPACLFSAWFTSLHPSIPQAIVVYDLIYELFPQYHAWWQTPLRNLARERRLNLERADTVIAISQSTAQDIARCYPSVDAGKIRVIQLGVDDSFFASTPTVSISTAGSPSKPYFLFVGFRTGHKNFLRLLHAYGQSGLAPEIDLRVVSAADFLHAEHAVIRQYALQDAVHRITNVADHELRSLYRQAVAFVYPSEYEGFGLPLLEAMASGTLVATADRSSMPEIAGDVAFYFDPYVPETIACALRDIASLATADRNRRIADGRTRAGSFSWQRCQSETVAVVEALLTRS